MKRKSQVKKRHWGWIIGTAITLGVLLVPLDVFVRFVYETQKKAEITEALLITLTGTAKAGMIFLTAIAAMIFYKVVK